MPDVIGTLKAPRQSTPPGSPVTGQLYFDTDDNILYWWNGSAWISASGGGGGVDYEGGWAAGTPYAAGDVVRHNGVDYLAVNPSTGQTPPAPVNLGAYQLRSEEGQANGYASLDSGGKVPSSQLPPISSIDYENVWAAGTAYLPGDVVRYGSTDYIAVNPSTGQTPPAAISSLSPVPISVGTSLPTSPFEGQEAILVDSLTSPTYIWRFRYTTSIPDAYKWLFIGGVDGYSDLYTNQQHPGPNASWANLSTPGPLFTCPRAGYYDVSHSLNFQKTKAEAQSVGCEIVVADGGASGGGSYWIDEWTGTTTAGIIGLVNSRHLVPTAGTVLRMKYYAANNSGSAPWMAIFNRKMIVRPIRVS